MRMIVLTIVLLLSGCVGNGVRPLKPLQIATAPYQGTVSKALTGSLMYEGRCLLFRGDDFSVQALPIWPSGTIFNGTSIIFHEPGQADQRVMLGEQFVMEGYGLQWAVLGRSRYYAAFHNQCGRDPFVVSKVRPAD